MGQVAVVELPGRQPEGLGEERAKGIVPPAESRSDGWSHVMNGQVFPEELDRALCDDYPLLCRGLRDIARREQIPAREELPR